MKINIEKLLDEADLLIGSFMYDQAITKYDYIIAHTSNCADAYLMRGALLGEMGKVDQAITDIETSISLDFLNDSAFASLAYLYDRKNDTKRAFELCEKSLGINNKNTDAIKLFVNICIKYGNETLLNSQFDKAKFYFKTALQYQTNDANLLYKLVLVSRGRGEIEESIAFAKETIAVNPNHIRAKAHIASSYELIGDIEKGNQLINELLYEYPDHPLVNIVYAQFSLRNKKQKKGITALTKLLTNTYLQKEDKNSAKMLLGTLYDSIGQYDSAFQYFEQANEMLHQDYDALSYKDYITTLINYFSKEKYSSIEASEYLSNELIFIIGMPRSGTSLTEQIISSHSHVFGAGELPFVNILTNSFQENSNFIKPYPACLDEFDTHTMNIFAEKLITDIRGDNVNDLIICDKMPHNFHHIGFLHKLLPNAKFINCIRDPRDTCLSIYFQSFAGYHPYASNLHSLGIHYNEYERLMEHWSDGLEIPILTVSYEDVVSNTREEVDKILNFLDLPWEENCMEFHKQKRIVATASYNQVNKKIYNSSIGRWKNYINYISELLDVLSMRTL